MLFVEVELIVENIDVSFASRFCKRSYNGASFFVVNVDVCGVRINERNNVDCVELLVGRFKDGDGTSSNKRLRSNVSGSVLMIVLVG